MIFIKKKSIKSAQHYIEYLTVCFALFLFRYFSFPTLSRIGDFLGGVAFHLVRIRRGVTLDNLRKAFPEKSDQDVYEIARRTYRNFGRTFIQFLGVSHLTNEEICQAIEFGPGVEFLNKVLKQGKGGLIIGGHFGNWEVMSMGFGAYGFPGNAVVKVQKNRRVHKLIEQIRGRTGIESIPLGSSIREIFKALRQNKFVGIAADQHFRNHGGAWVDFFGRPVLAAQGAAKIALKTGSPLICVFSYHQPDGRLTTKFEKLHVPLSGDTSRDILNVTQAITTRLEQEVRRYPDHWLWMHRRWKRDPPS